MAVLTEALRTLKPIALVHILDHRQLFLAEVALDALLTSKFACLLHVLRVHSRFNALFVYTLVTQRAKTVSSCLVCEFFTLFAIPALLTSPCKTLYNISVQVHAFAMDHDFAVDALK